jgi:hypothetical protein
VLDALARFGQPGDWQAPLAAALRIRPSVDRGVGGGHPIARFEVEPITASSPGLAPAGMTMFVDGEPASELPPRTGLYLVQLERDGVWKSLLVVDQAVPADWLAQAPTRPAAWTGWGHFVANMAYGGMSQRRDPVWEFEDEDAAFIPEADWGGLWPSMMARGGVSYGLAGLVGELSVGLAGVQRPRGSTAQAAAVVRLGDVVVGAGGGWVGLTAFEGDPGVSTPGDTAYRSYDEPVGHGLVTVALWGPTVDAGLSAGMGPSVARVVAHAGWALNTGSRGMPWRVGVAGSMLRGSFIQDETLHTTANTAWRAGVDLGLRLDRDR